MPLIELTDFQRFLTTHKQMTTDEAIEVCTGQDRERYVALFSEWERFLRSN